MKTKLIYRENYFNNQISVIALSQLVREIFHLELDQFFALEAQDPSARPFSYFDRAGACVANLTGFNLPLIIGGKRVEAIGLQSGAVRPEWRGRGLFRDLTRRVLDWCDHVRGADLVLLYTPNPELYTRVGFQVVQQKIFVGDRPPGSPASMVTRRLSIDSPEDVGLLRHHLARRTPVSDRVGVIDQRAVFLLHALLDRDIDLHHSSEADIIVATQTRDNGVLRLVDIVGPAIPPLHAILGALGGNWNRVEVCFPPDRLQWEGQPRLWTGATLMARGPLSDALQVPFMLPPTASF